MKLVIAYHALPPPLLSSIRALWSSCQGCNCECHTPRASYVFSAISGRFYGDTGLRGYKRHHFQTSAKIVRCTTMFTTVKIGNKSGWDTSYAPYSIINGFQSCLYEKNGVTTICDASGHLYARKMKCDAVTKICVYTKHKKFNYSKMREIVCVRSITSDDHHVTSPDEARKPDTRHLSIKCNAPWVCEWPYVITDWSMTHVRIDSVKEPDFWCELPAHMLPKPGSYNPNPRMYPSSMEIFGFE